MNIDWVTISVGHLENEAVRSSWFQRIRHVCKLYPGVFTSSYFGSYTVSIPGRVWQRFQNEQDGIQLVSDVCSMCATSHITRVDFAHDWTLPDTTEIWSDFAKNLHITRIEGDGRTWYSGSRESPFFARLYDKAKEIKARTGIEIDFTLLRFEVEVKREHAPELYAHYLRDRDAVVAFLAKKYNMSSFIDAISDGAILKKMKQPEVDPFAFVRRFQRVIRNAQKADPKLFDELFPSVTALQGDTAR